MKRLTSSALALATVMALAGCGGGGDTGGGTGLPVTGVPSTPVNPAPPGATPAPVTPPSNTPPPVTPPPATSPPPTTQAASCDSNATPRRLTQAQYINTLTDFVKAMTNDSTLAGTVSNVVKVQAQLAPDQLINPEFQGHEGLARLDKGLDSNRVTAVYTVAQSLASSMTSDANKVSSMLARNGQAADACLGQFIQKAGRLLFHKPVPQSQIDALRDAAGHSTAQAGVRAALATMMASPEVYVVLEHAPAQSSQCTALSGPELATRLALHFWDTVPDAALNAKADKPASDSGSLLNTSTYAQTVSDMVKDPRAERATLAFFSQWFRLDELLQQPMNGAVGRPAFDAFAKPFQAKADTSQNAVNEVLNMIRFLIAKDRPLQDILTNNQSFATTDDIAQLYNTPKWNGDLNSTPPTFPDADRAGIMGRIAFLANAANVTTSPIRRSVKFLGSLSCQALGLPAINQSPPNGVDVSGILSTRRVTELITEQTGTVCTTCHTSIINPWGYALEQFDALGRRRQKETLFSDSGAVRDSVDISTTTIVSLSGAPNVPAIAPRLVNSLTDAQQYLLDSGQFERCFARTYVRHALGRDTTAADEPLIDAIRVQAKQGLPLRTLLSQIALRNEFKTIKGAAQ